MSYVENRPATVPAPDSPNDEGLTPAKLLNIARKRFGILLFVAGVFTAAAAAYASGRVPKYESTATILIDPVAAQPLGGEVQRAVNVTEYWTNKEYVATQLELIKSRAIAARVVKKLGLHVDASFIENEPRKETKNSAAASEEAAINTLISRLTVEPQKQTRLVAVKFEDADPERARRVAAAVVEVFAEHNLKELETATRSAGHWLKTQLGDLKNELEASELALHKYKKSNEMLSVSYHDQSNMLREQIAQLGARITQVRAEREKLAARHQAIAAITPEKPEEIPAAELLASPLLQQLRSQYVGAVRERESLLAVGKGENHPEVQGATSSVNNVRDALLAELRAIQEGVQRDVEALQMELDGLIGLYETAKRQALDLNLKEIEYNRLKRVKDNNEKLYALVLEDSTESDLTSLLQQNNIRTVDAPRKGSPVGPTNTMIIGAGVLLGLLFGLGVATGRETLDRSIKSPDELERWLSVPLLGFLARKDGNNRASYGNYGRKRKPVRASQNGAECPLELIVHEHPTGAHAEAARALRTNITFTAPDKPYRRLLIASAAPGEGKTTVACWIAIAMAQAGQKVLLLDCDLRRPRIHKIFGKRGEIGITEAVINRALLDKVDFSTDIPNLSVLTAGPHVPNAAEILGSESFKKLLDDLTGRFDRIILDSPPITAVTDATILSCLVDGTVFVVRAFSTSRDVAYRAVRALRDLGSHVVGSVLNAADTERGGKGYYYQYYYRGNYGVDDAVAQDRSA